jgi:hypothetical protein
VKHVKWMCIRHLKLQSQRDFIVHDISMRPNATSFLILDWKSVSANTSKLKTADAKPVFGLPFSVGATHVGAISDPTMAATVAKVRFMRENAGRGNTQKTCCCELEVHVIGERSILKFPSPGAVGKPARYRTRTSAKQDDKSSSEISF